jgi:hypothetical protein
VSDEYALLRRLLAGTRVRAGGTSWRIADIHVTDVDVLFIRVDYPRTRVITIQLPGTFDGRLPRDIAWLFNRIQRHLQ